MIVQKGFLDFQMGLIISRKDHDGLQKDDLRKDELVFQMDLFISRKDHDAPQKHWLIFHKDQIDLQTLHFIMLQQIQWKHSYD